MSSAVSSHPVATEAVSTGERLALTLGATTAIGATMTGLWGQAQSGQGIARWDGPVLAWFVAHRDGSLTSLAQVVTNLASMSGVLLATALLMGVLVVRRAGWGLLVATALVSAATASLGAGIKLVTARARPPVADVLGVPSGSAAFPSGHTLSGTVLVGLLTLLVITSCDLSRRARTTLVTTAGALVVAIGMTRLYLGYHWLTDVLAGWLLAGGILVVTATWLVRHPTIAPPQGGGTGARDHVASRRGWVRD